MDEINHKLEVLYDLLVDSYDLLKIDLKELILNPAKIGNTSKFASLLSELKQPSFITPLLQTISLSDKGDLWLADFLYAAITLLDECPENEEFVVPKGLIQKLEIWILQGKGEISWKAANLLKFYQSERAEKIQLKKLEERGDFFLTYAECILGLLRCNKDKYMSYVKTISSDETRDKKLRDFANDVIQNY